MANEATTVDPAGIGRRFTVASGVAIAKGSLLKLTTPRTAIIHSAQGDLAAGIATMDKSATDFSTSITAAIDGVWNMLASGAITAGSPVMASAVVNAVEEASVLASGAQILGYALADIADAARGNIRVRL